MKKFLLLVVLTLLLGLAGCAAPTETPQILATTKPVYDLTRHLCADTDLSVGLLISENVSCLHDYSLSVERSVRRRIGRFHVRPAQSLR